MKPTETLRRAGEAYERHKDQANRRGLEISLKARDIGPIPEVVDYGRKKEALSHFRAFLEIYAKNTFHLAWSADHIPVIERYNQIVHRGGLYAHAVYRGFGKTGLAEWASVFGGFAGLQPFCALVGPTGEHALELIASVKTIIDSNDLLAEDFPEICFPIRKLDGIAQRAIGQLCMGKRTYIYWGKRAVVLPTIEGSPASGMAIRVGGLTSSLRGMRSTKADGTVSRPSWVVIDDPQTDESAQSPSQCRTRKRIVTGAIKNMMGPGVKFGAVMPCTIISKGDLADQFTDPKQHPEWHGVRIPFVKKFPEDKELWEQYAELRRESLRNGGEGEQATAFYKKNRRAMDVGAQVSWKERMEPGELSAVQFAMNKRIDDESEFFAEYQQEPREDSDGESKRITSAEVIARVSGVPRGTVPADSTALTAFIDVHGKLLYWIAAAWCEGFAGQVVDYGTWPPQREANFTLRNCKRTMQMELPGAGIEAAVVNGLHKLSDELLPRSSFSGTRSPTSRGSTLSATWLARAPRFESSVKPRGC